MDAQQEISPEDVEPLALAGGVLDFEGLSIVENGGVSSAAGFRAAGIHAGFRADPQRLDMALVVADEPCACAATFTQNVFCAAPVTVSRDHLDGVSYGTARCLVVNSGVANAATGSKGLEAAEQVAGIVGAAVGCPASEVMVASTGVIGVHLNLSTFETGAPQAVLALKENDGSSAARAIMTTDTQPKEYAVSFSGDGIGYPGATFTVGGMCKGSGMIMPNMATMIACLTTDAPVAPNTLHTCLKHAVDLSFNKITVDSDTSTNDSCYLFANGAAVPGCKAFEPDSDALKLFNRALEAVCGTLARRMAADGEGATRLITVRVAGAATEDEADACARTIANSPLVKTAIFGHDANWGRIAAAAGRSGARFEQENVSIDIMGMPVMRKGLPVPFDEEEALRRFERPEVDIAVDLGAGTSTATIWTCDFSHDYVTINGDYRT